MGTITMGNDEHGPAYPEPFDDRDQRRFDTLRETYALSKRTPPIAAMLVGWAVAVALSVWALWPHAAPAMNHGFNPDAPLTKWFESKIRPDSPPNSCCGKGDAYPVERYQNNGDHTYTIWLADGSAILYPDGTRRDYFDKATPIIVPDNKVNPPDDDLDNPTDVSWVFMRVSTSTDVGTVYCLILHPEGN